MPIPEKQDPHFIIGAGPTGLVLALELAKHFKQEECSIKDKIHIYEKRPEQSQENHPAVIILKNATIKKLNKIDPQIVDGLKKQCFHKKNNIRWLSLKYNKGWPSGVGFKRESEHISVPIEVLNSVLRRVLKDKYDIEVKWGHELLKVENENGICTAVIKNGESEEAINYSTLSLACGIGGARKFDEEPDNNINPGIKDYLKTPSVVAGFETNCSENLSYEVKGKKVVTTDFITIDGACVLVDTLRCVKGGKVKVAFCASLPKDWNDGEGKLQDFVKECMSQLKERYPKSLGDVKLDTVHDVKPVDAISSKAQSIVDKEKRMLVVGDAAIVTSYLLGNELNEVIKKYVDIAKKAIIEIGEFVNQADSQKEVNGALSDFSKECKRTMFGRWNNPQYYYKGLRATTKYPESEMQKPRCGLADVMVNSIVNIKVKLAYFLA